jgi:hypothetical protein
MSPADATTSPRDAPTLTAADQDVHPRTALHTKIQGRADRVGLQPDGE